MSPNNLEIYKYFFVEAISLFWDDIFFVGTQLSGWILCFGDELSSSTSKKYFWKNMKWKKNIKTSLAETQVSGWVLCFGDELSSSTPANASCHLLRALLQITFPNSHIFFLFLKVCFQRFFHCDQSEFILKSIKSLSQKDHKRNFQHL